MKCESTDFMFPMLADVYYPVVTVGEYGNVSKRWILDRTIACSFNSAGVEYKEEVKAEPTIVLDKILFGRVKSDIRISENEIQENAITNVLVTNIRTGDGQEIYNETAGSRKGSSTLFEVAKVDPFAGPFGGIEHYKVVLRRSENQGISL